MSRTDLGPCVSRAHRHFWSKKPAAVKLVSGLPFCDPCAVKLTGGEILERLDRLEGALNEHFRTELVKAHPRTGSPDEVKKYLGID